MPCVLTVFSVQKDTDLMRLAESFARFWRVGHLAGTISAPFEAGRYRQIAVKVIDDRGNALLVVKAL